MQMYMFFLRKHNLIKIITILNNNCMHNEYVTAEKNILYRFFCANVLAVCEEILIFVALNKKETKIIWTNLIYRRPLRSF